MLKLTSSFPRTCLVTALAFAALTGVYAQPKPERNYQFEDATLETLELFRKENDAEKKDYAKIVALLDDRLAKLTNKGGFDVVAFFN